MHKSCLQYKTMQIFKKENKKSALKESAKFIREDILHMIEEGPSLAWPPKGEDLLVTQRQPLELLSSFLKYDLHDSHQSESNIVENYIWTYSQDLVLGVIRGKYLTGKHILLANLLHSFTGQKISIDLISTFGNTFGRTCSKDKRRRFHTENDKE